MRLVFSIQSAILPLLSYFFMPELNTAQQEAVAYLNGPLMIIAGAGTGKTTVITQKIAQIITQKIAQPEEILALTFTEKAAREMAERVDALLEVGYTELSISTFHSFCQRVLEQYGLDIGISTQNKLLTSVDAWLLVREHLDRFNLNYYRPLGNPTRHIHELIKHFNKCKDELISPADYLSYAENLQLNNDVVVGEEKTRLIEIANAYHVYNQLLLEKNALDFGDLIFYTIKLLESRPYILASLQQRYRYILVDEFQDVNWAQYRLVQLLTTPLTQLTVVGDDDQSIYAFRGASVSNILRFKDDYPNAKEIILTHNFRSVQPILDVAHKLVSCNNPDRLEVKLNINKKLVAARINTESENENAVILMNNLKLEEEVNDVVKKILELKEKKPELSWSEFAILVRANNHAEPFINALDKKGIPYEFLASNGLFRQPLILDVLNFFKLLDNYHESPAMYRLLCVPLLGFIDLDVQKIIGAARKKSISYYETLKRAREFKLTEEGIRAAEKLLELIHEGSTRAMTEKPTVVLYSFLEKSGYLQHLAHQENEGNQVVIRQIQHLKHFFEQLQHFETTSPNHPTVAGFLEEVAFRLEAGDEGALERSEERGDAVQVLTVHAAKGLEFTYVFVVNLVEDRFPSRRRAEPIEIPTELVHEQLPSGDAHYQEERRLCYVALTRAKDKLFLCTGEDYGGARAKKSSRFLVEMDLIQPLKPSKKPPTLTSSLSLLNQPIRTPSPPHTEYELPKAFSFSQIKSYETCPYQYKLAHLIKIPTKGSASFSFGQSLHSTLQKFYQRVQELNSAKQISLFAPTETSAPIKENGVFRAPPMKELLEIYEKCWIGDWFENKTQRETYFQKGKDILHTFYSTHEKEGWTIPVALEGWFKIKIGQYLLHGRIDRIDQLPGGTLEIIDYKTGKSKEKLSAEDKDQLLLYQIAVEHLPEYQHLGAPSKLTFYYLNDNLKVSFLGSPKELESLTTKCQETIEKIHSFDFTPTPSSFACTFCAFKEICEFRIL